MDELEKCPCGQSRTYQECCGALHRGERKATTAEQLMRSRYTAFYMGEIDYLMETLHPSKRQDSDRQSLQNSLENCRWLKLEIHEVIDGAENDNSGFVEFSAYNQETTFGVLREKSRFIKDNGMWYYVDGEFRKPLLPGRNDLCWCGSNRKFKKCHGK